MKVFIICNSVGDLERLLTLGKPGLPYIPEWANIGHRRTFPIYAEAVHHQTLGIIFNSIQETKPAKGEILHVEEFEHYVRDVMPNLKQD